MKEEQAGGFKELLGNMMKRRWFITAIVLGGFMIIIMGIFGSIMFNMVILSIVDILTNKPLYVPSLSIYILALIGLLFIFVMYLLISKNVKNKFVILLSVISMVIGYLLIILI